jgi:DNA polymerase-3 subunit alpha
MVKIKPRSLKQVSVSSSVMRLMGNEDMIPIDRYASFIQDINLWYQEMKDAGLNEDEVKVLEKHLLSNNGASIEQEDLMTLLMDEKISGFDIVWSNKARKGLAKRDRNLIEQVSKKYYEDGEKLGTRKQMLDYVWKYCLKPQLG